MLNGRKKSRGYAWAPRALVVLSCALALLASQPASGNATHAAIKPALLDYAGEASSPILAKNSISPAHQKPAAQPKAPPERFFFASAQRLHILATFEILHRLLIVELQPTQRNFLPALDFNPICIEILSPIAPTAHLHAMLPHPHLPTSDQAFAIEHCLLAPPTD